MKRLFALLLSLTLLLGITACGNSADNTTDNSNQSATD